MHHKTLKSAVEKYLPLFDGTKSTEEITEAISQDEKGYTDEEVEEIITACSKAVEEPEIKSPIGKPTLNKQYEEWKVKPVITSKFNRETEEKERVVTFEKDAQSAIRITSITPNKAEILNQQSENTLLRLYEVK